MFLKLLLVSALVVIGSNGQIRIPVISRHNRVSAPQVLPSGNVRHFLTYPKVAHGLSHHAVANGLSHNAVAHGLSHHTVAVGAPVVVPAYEQLNKVATLGLTTGVTGGIALGAKAQHLGPVIAAIITHRTHEVVDVPVPPDVIQPQVLIVEPNLLPVTIEFRSQSSPVNINQVHIPGPPGEFKETRSEEEPDRVLHEVVKPVIQEVREIIQPFRKIIQEILPVQEEVHSVVARGENQKVIKEVAIPAPQPIAIAAAAPTVALAQPIAVAQRVAIAKPVAIAAEPLDAALTGPITGTIVRAGLIGGARVLEAPALQEAILESSASAPTGRVAIKRNPIVEPQSLNNRGPARPVKS